MKHELNWILFTERIKRQLYFSNCVLKTSEVPASLHTLVHQTKKNKPQKNNIKTSDDVFSFNYHVCLQQQPNIKPIYYPLPLCSKSHTKFNINL